MNNKFLRILSAGLQIALVLALTGSWLIAGSAAPAAALTVPTRTPVPPPGGGGGGGSGGSSSQPPPASPTAAPTATKLVVTIAPTPIDGFITPEPCGIPIFQASNGTVNVRSQPSTGSTIAGQLVFLESRGISGRFSDAEWWLIVMADGSQGWVSDDTGTVFGNTAAVLALDANQSPVEAPAWQPTPDPICPTLTPTPIPSATPTTEPTAEPTETSTVVPVEPSATPLAAEAADTAPTPEPTPTVAPPTAVPSPTQQAEGLVEVVNPGELPPASPSGGGPNLFLIAGIGLLLAGFAVYFVQRANRQAAE